MFFVLKFELILIIGSNNVLTEGAALHRAGLENMGASTSHTPVGRHGLLYPLPLFFEVRRRYVVCGVLKDASQCLPVVCVYAAIYVPTYRINVAVVLVSLIHTQ
jgi:hypothetical protein